MSQKKALSSRKHESQFPKKSEGLKRGVSATFIAWLLDGFTQMETAKVKIDHR
jgi:hypothetical protein